MSTPSFLLNELLTTVGTARMIIEPKKRQLVDLPSFTSASLFSLFDTEGKGHISLANLYDYLKLRYVFPSEMEIFTLFKQIDVLKMGLIEPAQLNDFFTPQTRAVASSKSHYGHLDSMVTAVLSQWLENFRNIETKKRKLVEQTQPTVVFTLLDSNKNGKVSTLEVRSFMLAHGCTDQQIISNTILDIQNQLGCNFGEQVFEAYLQPASEYGREEGKFSSKFKDPYQHVIQPVETRPVTSKTVNDFEQILEARSHQNEERRNYLKEQEKLRTKIMEDVLARKRSYLNVRAPEEALRINTEEELVSRSQQKERTNHFSRSIVSTKTAGTEEPLQRTGISPNNFRAVTRQIDREDVMKRAASEAQLKIEQIEANAKLRAEEKRRADIGLVEGSDGGFRELLLKKNSELEMEKQKRLTLQRELSKSKEEIALLKNHLQSINKLNYREIDLVKGSRALAENSNAQVCRQGEIYKNKPKIGLRESNREAGSIYEVGHSSVNRSDNYEPHRESCDNKYELEQALRRSRVEREFAKFKLEKELARSRLAWRG